MSTKPHNMIYIDDKKMFMSNINEKYKGTKPNNKQYYPVIYAQDKKRIVPNPVGYFDDYHFEFNPNSK